jgi:hypothetical protein
MTLDEARAHIGDAVVYTRDGAEPEEGVIANVGRVWVFVQYPGLDHPIAEPPGNLTLLAGLRTGSSDD